MLPVIRTCTRVSNLHARNSVPAIATRATPLVRTPTFCKSQPSRPHSSNSKTTSHSPVRSSLELISVPAGSTGLTVDGSVHSHLRLMARYHVWATEYILRCVSSLSDEEFAAPLSCLYFGSIHATLSHLVAADQLWHTRLTKQLQGDVTWADPLWADGSTSAQWVAFSPTRAQVCEKLLNGARALEEYVKSRSPAEIATIFDYRNTKGLAFKAVRSLALTHVFNHGTHHRGQISAALTQLGQEAPAMDLLYMFNSKA